MEFFISALGEAVQPLNLLVMLAGTFVGIAAGAMPGLSSVMALTIMTPFTFSLGGNSGFLMLLGIFCGSIYGGSITTILINTPGTANSAATCLDGYPMANKLGQPGRALGISTMASTFGGLFSAAALFFTAPLLAKVALQFGSPEYFSIAVFGISIVTGISSKSIIKGLIGAVIGLALGTVGIDAITGTPRFTFGSSYLTGGISFVPLLIALYAFSQGLKNMQSGEDSVSVGKKVRLNHVLPTKSDIKRTFPTILGCSVIGTMIGAIPGTGGDIASWFGYTQAKRFCRHRDEFGNGAPEGIAAPESANNAVSGGALIPLLTLGIPGDAGTAVMLGALMMQGIIPGPLLFKEQTEKVYIIIIGLIFANIMMCLLGYGGLKLFAKISSIPSVILTPVVFIFCFVGTYALNNNINDIYFMIIAGITGFVLLKLDFAMPPVILGLILGTKIETNLSKSLAISDGSFSIFFTRPISCVLLIIAAFSLLSPVLVPMLKRAAGRTGK